MKEAKRVLCSKCYRMLCKRVPIHLGRDESYILHVKNGKMELYTYDATIKCPSCRSTFRINGEDGITEKELANYDR